MILSNEQRNDLRATILEAGCLLESEKDDLLEAIAGWVERNTPTKSFSQMIIEAGEASKRCENCKQLCVIYWRKFEYSWRICLAEMIKAGQPMTYKELAVLLTGVPPIDPNQANAIARVFLRARHWGVIRKTDVRRNRCAVYEVTQYGREVMENKQPFPARIWIPSRKIHFDTTQLPKAPSIFMSDIRPDTAEELADRARYVGEAAPALPEAAVVVPPEGVTPADVNTALASPTVPEPETSAAQPGDFIS